MTYVVDASVVVKWFAFEDLRDQALIILDDIGRLQAPDFIFAEVSNVVWKKCMRGELSRTSAVTAILATQHSIKITHPSQALCERAMEIAFALNHPVYDCLYLACAENVEGILVTADARLCATARANAFGERVRHLSEVIAE